MKNSLIVSSLVASVLLSTLLAFPVRSSAATVDLYLGTYTSSASKGIYRSSFDPATGAVTSAALAAEMANPSFLILSANGKSLYAVSESGAAVAAFRRESDGSLIKLNEQPTGGAAPCHLVIAGHTLLVANYGGGSIAAFVLESDGRLGARSAFYQHTGHSVDARQKGPHAHGFAIAPDGVHVFVADLGLDLVKSYVLTPANGALDPQPTLDAALPPGSGPRHLAFSPDGRRLYCVNEIGNTVAEFTYDAPSAALKLLKVLPTLPADFHGNSTTAEIAVHPDGRFVYASNRGHDSLAVFSAGSSHEVFQSVEIVGSGGKYPRNFALTPDGRWLLSANRDTNNVMVFAIDAATGHLTPTSHTIAVPQPVCVAIAPPR